MSDERVPLGITASERDAMIERESIRRQQVAPQLGEKAVEPSDLVQGRSSYAAEESEDVTVAGAPNIRPIGRALISTALKSTLHRGDI